MYCFSASPFSFFFFFFSLQTFLSQSRNSRATSAKLFPICAVQQADAPAEVERRFAYHVWTSAVILFYSKEGGYYLSTSEHNSII